VESGERVFFRELASVNDFMSSHLKALGVETPNRFWDHLFPSEDR
jgi:hypothetical protein